MREGKKSPRFEFPEEQQQALGQARRLGRWTIAYHVSDAVLLYVVMGASQAMKTAFFEDLLALVSATAFLVSNRIALWSPDERFPYGYHRAVAVGYIAASTALLALGMYLLVNALIPLVQGKHPTIGAVYLFGHTIWLGWLMLAALVWATFPEILLGVVKLPIARKMHDKVLYADARMDRAGWLSGAAAALGVIGIGFGYWWADSVAAAVISLDIVGDGGRHLWRATCDAMDEMPRKMDRSRVDPVVDKVEDYLENLDWVQGADVRLRNEGHVFFGEAYVVPRDSLPDVETLHRTTEEIVKLDWRLHDIAVVPVLRLHRETNPNPEEKG